MSSWSISIDDWCFGERSPAIEIPAASTSHNRDIVMQSKQYKIQSSFLRKEATISKRISCLNEHFRNSRFQEISDIRIPTHELCFGAIIKASHIDLLARRVPFTLTNVQHNIAFSYILLHILEDKLLLVSSIQWTVLLGNAVIHSL